MSDPAIVEHLRTVLSLPVEQQREALMPLYRAAYDAYGSDWGVNTAAMADDHVFVAGGASRLPGLPERTLGPAGYLDAQQQMREALDVARIELDEVIPLGSNRVVAMTRFVISAGGGEVEQQCMELHEFRDGELVRQTYWFDRDEGRAAIGLTI